MDESATARFDGLLRGAKDGDPRSLDALVRLVDRPLVGYLRARGADDAEGLANEVLVKMCRHVVDFHGGERQFRGWVFTIARNRLIDEHRRAARRPELAPTPPAELPERASDRDPTDDQGQRERVEAMLATLTADQREVVILRIVAGLSVAETASVLGCRPGAVRALQHRALRQLRGKLSRTP
jgi:RNA polymerase sigma-70 factor (ECF subfamily)